LRQLFIFCKFLKNILFLNIYFLLIENEKLTQKLTKKLTVFALSFMLGIFENTHIFYALVNFWKLKT